MKEIMIKIGDPRARMCEMLELIKHVTSNLKSSFKEEIEKLQTNTYLITDSGFEKVFN
jgi:hypothetical protein